MPDGLTTNAKLSKGSSLVVATPAGPSVLRTVKVTDAPGGAVDGDDPGVSERGGGGRSVPGRFSFRTATDWSSSSGQATTAAARP